MNPEQPVIGVRMEYHITHAVRPTLTPDEVDTIQDDLWEVMVAWLEARNLRMNGGTTPYQDE